MGGSVRTQVWSLRTLGNENAVKERMGIGQVIWVLMCTESNQMKQIKRPGLFE